MMGGMDKKCSISASDSPSNLKSSSTTFWSVNFFVVANRWIASALDDLIGLGPCLMSSNSSLNDNVAVNSARPCILVLAVAPEGLASCIGHREESGAVVGAMEVGRAGR